jgi:hypothetical protein
VPKRGADAEVLDVGAGTYDYQSPW